ncbi:MAG: hypothetical protein AMJ79_04845, partial [Phycisphaerae bacterium SM23_30]
MINRKILILIGALALCFCTCWAEGQQEQWLGYYTGREAHMVVGDMGVRILPLGDEKPKGVELPEFESEGPIFARWDSPMAKNGHLWIALDRSHLYGPYDRLYIDANGDGALRDEAVISAYRTSVNYAYFGPVKVVFASHDGPITYHLNFNFIKLSDTKELRVYAGGWYEGEIKIGAAKKKCVLIDHNANGTFNDRSLDPGQCDRIRIDSETRFVGQYLEVVGVLYEPQIARDGACIKLTEAENVIFGEIRLPGSLTAFAAGGEKGLFNVKPEKGRAKLPVGQYRVNSWAIETIDDQDITWRLEGLGANEKGIFEINRQKTAIPAVGEPVIALLTVSK